MNPEMAKMSLQYCHSDLFRFNINTLQDFGVQAGLSCETIKTLW